LGGAGVGVLSLQASCPVGWAVSLDDDGDRPPAGGGDGGIRRGVEEEPFWAESGVEFRTA